VCEVLHNAQFLYRAFTDEFIWQAWASVWFVWAGTKVAPSNRFQTSLVLAGFKVVVALYNSLGLLQYVHSGGSWADSLGETQAPIWWRLCVEIIAIVAVALIPLRERKEADDSRWGYVPKLMTVMRYDFLWYGVLLAWVALDHVIPNASAGYRNIQMVLHRWTWAFILLPSSYVLLSSIVASIFMPLQLAFVIPSFFANRQDGTFAKRYGFTLLAVLGIFLVTLVLRLMIWGSFPLEVDNMGVQCLRIVPFFPFPSRTVAAWK
jgi:hypothetical protein